MPDARGVGGAQWPGEENVENVEGVGVGRGGGEEVVWRETGRVQRTMVGCEASQ